MPATVLAFVTALVLAFAYAALDDITTNPQPDYTAEYLWLALATAWLIAMVIVSYRRGRR